MSCECETQTICVGGRTYNATFSYNARGEVQDAAYTDENLVRQVLAPGSFRFGACALQPFDVFRVVQPLIAGNNIITHNLGSIPTQTEVRNNATGAIITARVVAETANTTTIFVPVAVPSARISLDV